MLNGYKTYTGSAITILGLILYLIACDPITLKDVDFVLVILGIVIIGLGKYSYMIRTLNEKEIKKRIKKSGIIGG